MHLAWVGLGLLALGGTLACGENVVDFDDPAGAGGAGAAGSTGSGAGTTSTASSSASSSTGVGGGAGEWVTLIEGDWSLPSGTEGYYCVTTTMTEDVWVAAFRPLGPEGTHHTVLTKGGFGEDGVFPCDFSTNGQNMLYGSGVGSDEMILPEGVAMRLSAGDKLLLNLHLFNAGGSELTGVSGTEVRLIAASEVEFEAQATLAGTFGIALDPQSEGSATGSCSLGDKVNLFAVGPHMHQFGTRMVVTAELQSGPVVVHDAPYSFEDQLAYMIAPSVTLDVGDTVRVDCSYNNTSNQPVSFGDSSNAEMCFATLWVYPPPATGLLCAN